MKSDMHTEWTDRLSDYIDGLLPPPEAGQLEAHLDACPACAAVLDELRTVVSAARGLEATPPARDLWPEIRAAIDAPGESPRVIDLATRLEGRRAPRKARTLRVTVPQLVAAGLALAFASGGTVWMVRPDRAPDAAVAAAGDATQATRLVAAPATASAPVSDGTHTDELAELEELLAAHRTSLAPNTIRILEKNLAAIDRAITESMEALASDPGNEFLQGHLERARERKLEYLREASVAFQWTT